MKLLVTGGAGYVGSVCAATWSRPATRWSCSTTCPPGTATRCRGAPLRRGRPRRAADDVLAEGFDGVLHFAASRWSARACSGPSCTGGATS